MKKYSVVIVILSLLLIIVTTIAVLNIISIFQMKKVTYGMSFEEVNDLLGRHVPSSFSGMDKKQWRLPNGDIIRVIFDYSSEARKAFVVGYYIE